MPATGGHRGDPDHAFVPVGRGVLAPARGEADRGAGAPRGRGGVRVEGGRLTARPLNLPVEFVDFYDPERHFREVRGKGFGGSSTGHAEEMDTDAARGGYT